MLLFLQNWRATLIPTIAVPVVLLGTFGIMSLLGFSINTLSMFGMVLPLVISTGAGANARNAIGTSVMGGMIIATVLVIFFAPLFFVLICKLFSAKPQKIEIAEEQAN